MKYTLLAILILFTACNPKHRAMRKVFKLSEKYDLVDTFSVTFHDTIIQPKVDTVFRLLAGDTIRIDTGTLHVQLIRLKGDTVFLNDTFYVSSDNFQVTANCDTIFINETVFVSRPFVSEISVIWSKVWRTLKRWWWLLIIGLSIGLLFKYGKKIPYLRNFMP